MNKVHKFYPLWPDEPTTTPKKSVGSMSYDERFDRFNARYPEVYVRLVKMARATRDRGFIQYSIKTLWCVLRFEIDLAPLPVPYKLPDQYHSRYSRLIMKQESDLKGFFSTRTLRTQ